MNTFLLAGSSPQEHEQIKLFWLNNKIVLDKLVKMMYNMYTEVENVSTPDYDNPSWSHKQAHLNGKKEVIRSLIGYLSLDKDENPLTNN